MDTTATSNSNLKQDPSPYIRTYAKDFAALTGKKIPPSQLPHVKPVTTFIPPDPALVTKEAPKTIPDLSILEKQADQANEQVAHSPTRESQITPITPAVEIQQEIPPAVFVGKAPVLPTLAPINPTAGAGDMREELLQRLRSRMQTDSEQPPVTAPPEIRPITPQPSEIRELPKPIERKPVPKAIPVVVAPLPPPVVEIAPLNPASQPPAPFHSYSSDFANRIDQQHASTFSVLAAEKDAAPVKTIRKVHNRSWVIPVLIGCVLLLLAGGGVFAAYKYMSSNSPVASSPSVPSLIVPDSKVTLAGYGVPLQQALAHEVSQPLGVNTIKATYLNSSTTTPRGIIDAPQSGGAFFSALALPAPSILSRNVSDLGTVGVVHAGNETRAFFVLRVSSYERTFAGMLSWENTMLTDLALYYPNYDQQTPPNSTFTDEIVSNHDTRVLKDLSGKTLILYGYADKQTLVIARDEDAFTLLISRLKQGE